MTHRDFDFYKQHDYGQPAHSKRHRHQYSEGPPPFERDDQYLEERLATAERALREQRLVLADIAGLVKEQQATIELLRSEAATALQTEMALKEQVADLEARLLDAEVRIDGLEPEQEGTSDTDGSDGPDGSDAEGDYGEESDDGDWEHEL